MNEKVVIAGKSDIACLSLIWLSKSYKNLDLYVLPSKSDLDFNSWQLSLKYIANQLGIKLIHSVDEIYHDEKLIFISMEYDRLIDTKRFKSKRLFNFHFSKLPNYRGVFTSIFPILKDESESGVTLHLIDDSIDGGKIIDQITFDISGMTSFEVYREYNIIGFKLFKNNFEKLLFDNYLAIEQNEGTIFYRSDLDFNIKNLDQKVLEFNSISDIIRIIRAFDFPHYQRATLFGKNIISYKIVDEDIISNKSVIENVNENLYLISLNKGILLIETEERLK